MTTTDDPLAPPERSGTAGVGPFATAEARVLDRDVARLEPARERDESQATQRAGRPRAEIGEPPGTASDGIELVAVGEQQLDAIGGEPQALGRVELAAGDRVVIAVHVVVTAIAEAARQSARATARRREIPRACPRAGQEHVIRLVHVAEQHDVIVIALEAVEPRLERREGMAEAVEARMRADVEIGDRCDAHRDPVIAQPAAARP